MNNLKKWFTLLEMLIVATILGLVFWVVINMYYKLLQTKTDIYVRSILSKNTNLIAERINLIMKNYTIDYEEYFNRRITWCDSNWWENFTWNVGTNWYCDKFTNYWNGNSVDSNNWNNILYYCSSIDNNRNRKENPWGTDCEWSAASNWTTWTDYIYAEDNTATLWSWHGCWRSVWNNKIQSYWEYAVQFWDVNKNADGTWWCKWDDDDVDLWRWPIAIWNNTWVKELYLISKDWKKRIFLRRKLVFSWDLNHDGKVDNWEKLYKLQILKLRGFDLWDAHNWSWVRAFDWKIDTWACDKIEWFICHGDPITMGNVWYNMPASWEDGWQDLTITDLSIKSLNFAIYPNKKPSLNWQDNTYQISPYISMEMETSFYWENYMRKLNPASLSWYSMKINTIFCTKEY